MFLTDRGKEERFHRTLKTELLNQRSFIDPTDAQRGFDSWRDCDNLERPHESLQMATPSQRFRISGRSFPETLAPIERNERDQVRKVQEDGTISYLGRSIKISRALSGSRWRFDPQHRSIDAISTTVVSVWDRSIFKMKNQYCPACGNPPTKTKTRRVRTKKVLPMSPNNCYLSLRSVQGGAGGGLWRLRATKDVRYFSTHVNPLQLPLR